MEGDGRTPGHIGIFLWSVRQGAFANLGKVLAKGFFECGVRRIDLITLEGKIKEPVDLPPGAIVIPLGCEKSSLSIVPLLFYLKKMKPDVLISLSWTNNIPAILAHSLYRTNSKLIITEHSSISYKSKIEHKNELKLKLMPILMRLLYNKADGLIAVSQGVISDLEKSIKLRIDHQVVHNPVDIEKIENCSKEEIGHEWFSKENRKKYKIILGVGRLARQKRFDVLIKAFNLIRKDNCVKLLILGEGKERQKLEKIIEELGCAEDVELIGFQNNPYAYMGQSDMFVLSSEEEGFGLVLLEAMVCNCPIVSIDLDGGPRDILGKGKFGYLVRNNDINDLANAMISLLNDDELAGWLSENGKKQVAKFSARIKAREYLTFIASIEK